MPMGQLCSVPKAYDSPRGHAPEPLMNQHGRGGRFQAGDAPAYSNGHGQQLYSGVNSDTRQQHTYSGAIPAQSTSTSTTTNNTREGGGEVSQPPRMPPAAPEADDHHLEDTAEHGQASTAETPMNFTKGKLIGQGAFGTVFSALKDTGEIIAVKQVALTRDETLKGRVTEHIKALEDEVRVLRTLRHHNIVQYLGTSRSDDTLNIFLEFVSGGSIASLIEKFGKLQESVVRVYTKQILRGLEYLHQKKIMHRDIKGANILVDGHGTVKLADFGASKRIENLATMGSGDKSIRGTPYWMAPEVIKQTGHGRPADIWSTGCVVIEMASGRPPWSNCHTQVSAMFHIASTKEPPEFPEHLSAEAKDFLSLCFNRVPKERPNATRLLKHPWMLNTVIPSDATSRSAPSLPMAPPVSRAPPSPVREDGMSPVTRASEAGPSRPPLPRPADPSNNLPSTPQLQQRKPPVVPPLRLPQQQASPRMAPKPHTPQQPLQSSAPDLRTSGPLSRNLHNQKLQKSQVLQSSQMQSPQMQSQERVQTAPPRQELGVGDASSVDVSASIVASEQRPASPPSPVATPMPKSPEVPVSPNQVAAESECQLSSEMPLVGEDDSSENVQPALPAIAEDEDSVREDSAAVQMPPMPHADLPSEAVVRSSMLTLDFNPMAEPSWMPGSLPGDAADMKVPDSTDKGDEHSATSPLEMQESEPQDVVKNIGGIHMLVLEESLAKDPAVSKCMLSSVSIETQKVQVRRGEDPQRLSKVQQWEKEVMAELEEHREQQKAARASLAQS